ncbi:MAG: hypothetical protein BAJALOKI1v1_220002 [Promethearchaeota archaeon]|nr:MAG: hypothetical protein BAJALOKI1v1_220002 [Candidatus Lokiarchaeota archaeon]
MVEDDKQDQEKQQKIEIIKELVNEGRIDDAVDAIRTYLHDPSSKEGLNKLEDILEAILSIHGGKTVLRFLIEHKIINVPSLLENLSKRDSVLRYSFLLLLKPIVEVEHDLFLPYIEGLLKHEDPNVKEAALQLLIFIVGGDKEITDENKIQLVASKLSNEKDYVKEKAIQALKAIGKKKPSVTTKILGNFAEEHLDDDVLKKKIDDVLKSIVSVEKIEEIATENVPKEEETSAEETTEEYSLEKKKQEIIDKEKQLKEKDLELQKKKLELEEKEKELQEKELQEKQKVLERKEKLLEMKRQLIQVELELKEKELSEKEQEIKLREAKRIQERINELGDSTNQNTQ